jgi:hypothetical protein
MNAGILIGFSGYLVLMLGIGIFGYVNGKKNNMEDYILGGRNFGPLLTAFGTGTTLASAAVFLGYVGLGYNVGLVAMAQVITACLFEFFGWKFLARRLRNYSIHTGSMTPVEALSKLKGDPHNLIKIIGGFLVGTFVLFYLSGQINGGAKAVTAMNIDFKTAGILCTILVIVYTMLGGGTQRHVDRRYPRHHDGDFPRASGGILSDTGRRLRKYVRADGSCRPQAYPLEQRHARLPRHFIYHQFMGGKYGRIFGPAAGYPEIHDARQQQEYPEGGHLFDFV